MLVEIELSDEWNEEIPDNIDQSLLIDSYGRLILSTFTKEFFQLYWEKKPCYFHSHSNTNSTSTSDTNSNLNSDLQSTTRRRVSRITSLFSKKDLLSLSEVLSFHHNMNVVKYISMKRINYEETTCGGIITKKKMKTILNNGYTVQFFQPQRFSNNLYYLCSQFEDFFGTLAGASAYLTPPNTQGLAPHWDDVEVFILQTEGTKQWNLWEPSGIPLPDTYSKDIPRSTLSASPNAQLILYPGDILYLPRGTIHEAVALDTFSTHITISVYQKYHNKSLIERIIPTLLEKFFNKPSSNSTEIPNIRKGLPRQISNYFGSFVAEKINIISRLSPSSSSSSSCTLSSNSLAADTVNVRQQYLSDIKLLLHEMADSLEVEEIDTGVENLGDDFCINRLPDPKLMLSSSTQQTRFEWDNKFLTLQSYQSIKSLTSFFNQLRKLNQYSNIYLQFYSTWLHSRVENVEGVNYLLIGTGRNNNRMNHMGHPSLLVNDEDVDLDEDENNQISDGFEWVKLTLPARYQELISLLSISNQWFSFAHVRNNIGKRFVEEEIYETLFGLHKMKLLDFAITDETISLQSKRKHSSVDKMGGSEEEEEEEEDEEEKFKKTKRTEKNITKKRKKLRSPR